MCSFMTLRGDSKKVRRDIYERFSWHQKSIQEILQIQSFMII